MHKLIGVLGMLVLLGGFAHADEAYLSLTPGGPPVDYVYLEPCETITLYVVVLPTSATASSFNVPMLYDPLVAVVDFGFHVASFDEIFSPGLCVTTLGAWNFSPILDEPNLTATLFCYTTTYPTCDIPVGVPFDYGWITFHCIGAGQTWIMEGVSPQGLPLIYTNGTTAIDYYPLWTDVLIEQGGTGVKEGGLKDIPKVPFLASAKPSLFSGSTSINYGITVDEHVSLKVYNAAGQAVRTLVNDNMKAGSYTANWDGRDDMGRQLSSGVYFTKLNTESINSSRKLVLR